MTNVLLHAIALIAAIVLPGGLLVYFAWRTACSRARPPVLKSISDKRSAPEEARAAFQKMFPRESLRAQSRRRQLERVKAYRRRNSENNK